MLTGVYSIKDVKSGTFAPGFTAAGDQIAVRMLRWTINDKQQGGMINKYPEDFELWKIADFNDETATFTTDQRCLVSGISLLEIQNVSYQQGLKESAT
nr:MAG: nonstructural protein [Microviridae sp.]